MKSPRDLFVLLMVSAFLANAATEKTDSAAPAAENTRKPVVQKAAAPQPVFDVETVPTQYNIRIPAGVLFGQFTREDGPFLIEGSIIVPVGQVLEFAPGTKVYLGGKYPTITVFGQMVCKGTAENPILFRSANEKANPWDWDRIYVRSRNRSTFEHCRIMHSNYGLFIENGSAAVNNCTFEYNSLHGLVVRNSQVTVRNTMFRKGHVLSMLLQEGAQVTAESLVVRDNITGIAVKDKALFKLTGGEVTGNTNGLAFTKESSIEIVAADITKNRTGVVSMTVIDKDLREMVYHNSVDAKVMGKTELDNLLKPPEEVKSIVLPKSKTQVSVDKDFKAGFSALKAPREPTASFIGNVTAGFKWFFPESDIDTLKQTRYPGEQNDKFYAGLQPETQLFMSGRRGKADVNLLADFYGNEWSSLRKNMFNLSMNYANQSLILGDFYESGSEASISGRQMTGLKFKGSFWDMGRGNRRVEFSLAGGETEVPKDSGQNELDLYNEKVDSAMSVRQQLTYIAGISIKPTANSRVSAKGIIARDQTNKPIFRQTLADPGAPDPIGSESGAIDGEVTLLGGNLVLAAEVDLGTHDTLAENADVAWYNPEIPQAIGDVFGKFTDPHHFAGSFDAKYTIEGYNLAFNFSEIQRNYFSAGNPYLEADRRSLSLKGDKQVLENLSVNADYTFGQSYASYEFDEDKGTSGPLFKNTLNAQGKYAFGENKPELNLNYTMELQSREEYKNEVDSVFIVDEDDVPVDTQVTRYTSEDHRELKNYFGLEAKQRFANGIDYSVSYRFLWTDDITDYILDAENDLEDEFQHQVNARFGFKIKRILTNKFSVRVTKKDEVRNEFDGYSYKISDQATFNIIPRKLSLKLNGEYSNKVDEEYDNDAEARVRTRTSSYNAGAELKYTLTSKLSATALGRYEKALDENDGSTENYRLILGGFNMTYLF